MENAYRLYPGLARAFVRPAHNHGRQALQHLDYHEASLFFIDMARINPYSFFTRIRAFQFIRILRSWKQALVFGSLLHRCSALPFKTFGPYRGPRFRLIIVVWYLGIEIIDRITSCSAVLDANRDGAVRKHSISQGSPTDFRIIDPRHFTSRVGFIWSVISDLKAPIWPIPVANVVGSERLSSPAPLIPS